MILVVHLLGSFYIETLLAVDKKTQFFPQILYDRTVPESLSFLPTNPFFISFKRSSENFPWYSRATYSGILRLREGNGDADAVGDGGEGEEGEGKEEKDDEDEERSSSAAAAKTTKGKTTKATTTVTKDPRTKSKR